MMRMRKDDFLFLQMDAPLNIYIEYMPLTFEYSTQVKVDRPVHARSKHARYMHNDAQQCNGPAQTGLLQACKFKISKI